MLHDGVMARLRRLRSQLGTDERRESDRLPFPAELVVAWNHDFTNPIRYRIIDAGDGGYRICSSEPVVEGMTGMVLRLLPSRGESIDKPVMVVWSHAAETGEGYEIGLRCM